MNPRDRLWTELIFPLCEPASLVALRAACRGLRDQLNAAPARLWLWLTMGLTRMRYDERLLGWRGVERAMQRESDTRANCEAGRCKPGPVLPTMGTVECVLFVGGRIAASCEVAVQLFDVDAGAEVAVFEAAMHGGMHSAAVEDRWLPYLAIDGRVLLLDCVAARLVELARPAAYRSSVVFSVAGPCLAYQLYATRDMVVLSVSGEADGTTVVREVARVALSSHYGPQVRLCDGGRAYVLCSYNNMTLRLMDMATGQPMRTFTPRA